MKYFLLLLTIAFLYSCSENDSENQNTKIFSELSPEQTSITFSNKLIESDSLNYFNYGYIYMGGGISAGDINNDGLVDLFFTGNMVPNKLYLNKGNLKFEDISEAANITGDNRWFTGVTMADVNADGYLDIYCSVSGKYGPRENLLYINNGDTTFTERAEQYGIADNGHSIQSTFFDYDLDGDLDLYVANYPPTKFSTPNSFYQYKMQHTKAIESDQLYRNDGSTFTNVTDEANVKSFGLTNSAMVSDINNDGWPDIYVSNDFNVPDYLYINNQNGTFTENVQRSTSQTALFGMGVDIADFNNDGLLDILQMDMTPGDNRRSKANMASMNTSLFWGTVNAGFGFQYMQNMLQLNNGMIDKTSQPKFSNISRLAGVSTTDWSWGPLFADLDNDGWKDIFITNGTRREINNKDYFDKIDKKENHDMSFLEKSLGIPSEKIDNFVFRNKGDLTFEKVNDKWGLSFSGFSNGSVYVDLDNDGDLEIVINNVDDYATVFENSSSDQNNFLALKFKGPNGNVSGLGVKVTLYTNDMVQYQELTLSRGFQSSVAPRLHFGLGKIKVIDTLKIIWPDGKSQLMWDVEINQTIVIDHSQSINNLIPMASSSSTQLFGTERDTNIIISHEHVENLYDDFEKEILLPHQTSMLGPNVSVGDLNNDGLDDIVIGGAMQSTTGIYFQTNKGFKRQNIKDIEADSNREDLGSLIFDADGDGNNDIYIVSGGNEFDEQSQMLQDRLYINNGHGQFTKSEDALPVMLTSGSRVYSADYDQDGDLDLFICGRLVPGNYPQPAHSYLLENVSTTGNPKFNDVTDIKASGLKKLGMATSASWADIDGDGWKDLIVVGEWMPITVFKNNNGLFTNISDDLGLQNSTGWWFSIQEGDFDKDGDIDFIVGNNGLNFKYQANANETFDIYLNDFDKNNSNDIVLSYFDEGEKFPVRGRECSSQQIPAIKKKYKNYDVFSNATLEDIYTKNDLDKSLHYKVSSFASVYAENRNGQFVLHKLPNLAQVSSINQIVVNDFDNDSNLDIVIAGNLYMTEVETPRNDASIGLFLQGDGHGNFKAIEGHHNGLYFDGDVKDMALISIQNSNYIVVARNNEYLQFVKIKN